MLVGFAAQELDHGNVIGKCGGGGDHFVKIGGVGAHLFQSFVELLGTAKVVKREDQSGAVAQLLQLRWLALECGLNLDVNELAAHGRGFGKDVELRSDRTAEFTSTGDAAA